MRPMNRVCASSHPSPLLRHRRGSFGRHLPLLGIVGLLGLGACASDEKTPAATQGEEGPETISDDATERKDFIRNARDLDLGDLTSLGAGFATDGLNDALSSADYASAALAKTELYALSDRAKNDLTLHDLDALVSGLAVRFGEKELTTEVNDVRRQHLASSNDKVYAECAFRVGAGVHDWGKNVPGFGDANVRLGFRAEAGLEARIIRAYESETKAQLDAPLSALKATRGFVLPRSASDIANLAPGESIALHGQGALGANLGVGVPILIANPGALTYNLVISASARAWFEGDIDVQLVRLAGDEIVVDVGMERAAAREVKVAVKDGFGIQGLLKSSVKMGNVDVDLGKLAEKAFNKRVADKLHLVDASIESTKRSSRLSVARFRFHLNQATEGSAVEQALAQALRADLRLAQALAAQGNPGVVAEFELSRSGVSATSYAGIDVFGMSFFRKAAEAQGTATVQTPGGVRTFLFESLRKESGSFFSTHGYGRTALSGLVTDAKNPTAGATGEANLFLQVLEGDDFMERDKLLDHLDAVILGVGGDAALAGIAAKGNELERYTKATCGNDQACRLSVLNDPKVVALRAEGRAALDGQLGNLDGNVRELVLTAGDLRLTAQATVEPAAQFVGPGSSVLVDYRLDDGALTSLLTSRTGDDFARAAQAQIAAHERRRDLDPAKIAGEEADLAKDNQQLAAQLGQTFTKHASYYQKIVDAEKIRLPAHPELGALGTTGAEIRFTLVNGAPDYEAAALRSLPQARATIATELFDELLAQAKAGDPHPEHTVAYSLLSLTEKPRLDLRVQVQMDLKDGFAQGFEHYRKAGYKNLDVYARASGVAPIDGGLFNVDDIVDVTKLPALGPPRARRHDGDLHLSRRSPFTLRAQEPPASAPRRPPTARSRPRPRPRSRASSCR